MTPTGASNPQSHTYAKGQEIRTRYSEYHQALDAFDAAKVTLDSAVNDFETADADLQQAEAAGIRGLLPEPIDTTVPVWNIEADLRDVEVEIDRLDSHLRRLGIPSVARTSHQRPEPEPEPESEASAPPPRTRREFFERGPGRVRHLRRRSAPPLREAAGGPRPDRRCLADPSSHQPTPDRA